MTTNKLRRLVYSTGAIGALGVLVSISALDRVIEATARGDAAIEVGMPANDESSRATLLLGLSATLTPLLIFLNVLSFAVSTEGEPTHYRVRRDNREKQAKDNRGVSTKGRPRSQFPSPSPSSPGSPSSSSSSSAGAAQNSSLSGASAATSRE